MTDEMFNDNKFRILVVDAEQIRAIDPNIQIVIVTGYSGIDPSEISQHVPPGDKLLYIQKPFHSHEIRQLAATLSAKWKVEAELVKHNEYLEELVEQRTCELVKAKVPTTGTRP